MLQQIKEFDFCYCIDWIKVYHLHNKFSFLVWNAQMKGRCKEVPNRKWFFMVELNVPNFRWFVDNKKNIEQCKQCKGIIIQQFSAVCWFKWPYWFQWRKLCFWSNCVCGKMHTMALYELIRLFSVLLGTFLSFYPLLYECVSIRFSLRIRKVFRKLNND